MEISLKNLFVDIAISQMVPTPSPPASLFFNHVIFYLEYLFQIMWMECL